MSPTRYWPWPPMLNRPQRNANATASAVRISGVVSSQRLLRGRGPTAFRSCSETPGEEPVEAGALEDRLVRRERVVAGDRARPGRRSGRRRSSPRPATMTPPRALVERSDRAGRRRRGRVGRRARLFGLGGAGTQARSAASSPAAARHREPELLARRVRAELGDDLALVDHEDAVGRARGPPPARARRAGSRGPRRAPRRAGGGRTRSRRRRGRASAAPRQHLRVAVDLARDDDLLLVAARERAGAASAGRRRGRRTP